MRSSLFSTDDPSLASLPSRPLLTRSDATRLPSVEDLSSISLKTTHQKHHCMPPTDLHDCIARVHPKGVVRERQWQAIQLRTQTQPDEACRLDRRGRSCLHAACAKKPPLSVVKAILNASSDALLVEQDNHGRTPLAISISSNASLDVIEYLLEKEPRAASVQDHLGRLPLHLACIGYDYGQSNLIQTLLRVNAEACRHETKNGRTAIFLAIEVGAPAQVIQILAQSYPEAVEMNGCGMNSLFVAIEQNATVQVIEALVNARPQVSTSRDKKGAFPLRRAMEKHAPTAILKCLCTCPEVVLDTSNDNMENTALHSAFECGIPRESMVKLLVAKAPQVASMACRSGHTPLSLACRKYVHLAKEESTHAKSMWNIVSMLLRAARYGHVHSDFAGLLESDDLVVHAAVSTLLPKKIVMAALELYPEQARMPDLNGRYPLSLALTGTYEESKSDVVLKVLDQYPEAASFLTSDNRTMLSVAATSRSIDARVIVGLVKQNPAHLRQLDPQQGLYPFQLAALQRDETSKCSLPARIQNEWDKTVNQDLMQLSVMLQLLLAAPDLVSTQPSPAASTQLDTTANDK